jgi:hypothetical protein
METNILIGSIITHPEYYFSSETGWKVYPSNRRNIGCITVSFTDLHMTTTYNTEVIIIDEIDKHYSSV